MEKLTIEIMDETGRTVQYEPLIEFRHFENGQKHVLYTDGSVDGAGATRVFASVYDPSSEPALRPVQTKAERALMERLLSLAKEDWLHGEYSLVGDTE